MNMPNMSLVEKVTQVCKLWRTASYIIEQGAVTIADLAELAESHHESLSLPDSSASSSSSSSSGTLALGRNLENTIVKAVLYGGCVHSAACRCCLVVLTPIVSRATPAAGQKVRPWQCLSHGCAWRCDGTARTLCETSFTSLCTTMPKPTNTCGACLCV